MAIAPGVNRGKTAFVEGQLRNDEAATVASINRAWNEAGNIGSISGSLVRQARSRLGLTGKRGADGGKRAAGPTGKAKGPKGKPVEGGRGG